MAFVEDVRYTLGPVEDWSAIPEAARLRQRGNYVLVLYSEREQRPLGVFALRPRLAPGVSDLVHACQRYGVELAVLTNGDQIAAQAGATGDVLIIGATILASVAVGVWQEHKANRVAEALKRMGTSTARVLRDGQTVTIPANELVAGDVQLLSSGDRVAADVRMLSSQGLEVDEAALTGESLPVPKSPDGVADASRVILEGSDVTSGSGRAVVVTVGRQTRMGATAAALSTDETEQSPLGVRLSRLVRLILPISIAGGALVILAGFLQRRPLNSLLGATLALAGVPEGLPLLTRISEAGGARRLANRNAVVRRLSAVEALGRVDVACTDKTGTMTEGHLA